MQGGGRGTGIEKRLGNIYFVFLRNVSSSSSRQSMALANLITTSGGMGWGDVVVSSGGMPSGAILPPFLLNNNFIIAC
jgi:hypothetical protein